MSFKNDRISLALCQKFKRRFRRRDHDAGERDERGRRKWPEERIPINLEPIPGFNLRAQVVGQGGVNVKHIQQETQCRVQIKGRGSGFYENDTGRESEEEMYLHLAGPNPDKVAMAKELAEQLLEVVRENYAAQKERPPPQQRVGGGFRDRGSGSYGGREDDQYRPLVPPSKADYLFRTSSHLEHGHGRLATTVLRVTEGPVEVVGGESPQQDWSTSTLNSFCENFGVTRSITTSSSPDSKQGRQNSTTPVNLCNKNGTIRNATYH